MHDDERAACRAAAARVEREFDARTTRLWPRAWLEIDAELAALKTRLAT